MTAPDADGGEALLQACTDLGADYIFSSAGSEWAPVWEALARREAAGEAAPRYLDLAHETIAVGMATGYAAVTGRVRAVLLHAGAGLLQGANAVQGALLTGVPVVVCSGESTGYGDAAGRDPGSQWYRNLSIVGGPQAFAAPFTKWATVAADEDVDAAARLLAAAQRPVLAVESAGQDADAYTALVELADLLAIAVVEPQSAVCTNFPRTHPLHQGGDLAALAADADLVVLLGCRAPWYPPGARPGTAKVLVIDEVPHRPYMAYQVLSADRYVGGEATATLRAIIARLRGLNHSIDADVVAARRERLAAAHAAADTARRDAEQRALGSMKGESEGGSGRPGGGAGAGPVDPVAVAAALRDLLDGDAAVVDETITHSRTIARHLMASVPGRYRYVQGARGQGRAVTLGAKLAMQNEGEGGTRRGAGGGSRMEVL